MSISWFGQILHEIHKKLHQIAKPLTILTRQRVKFDWTPSHYTAFLTLKEAIIQAPNLHYPNPNKRYIIYTDESDDACGAQTFTRTQWHGIPNSFSIPHLHRNPKEMMHIWTGGLWSLLCCNKMELLPSRHRCHGEKWTQATHKVLKWKKCQHQN